MFTEASKLMKIVGNCVSCLVLAKFLFYWVLAKPIFDFSASIYDWSED